MAEEEKMTDTTTSLKVATATMMMDESDEDEPAPPPPDDDASSVSVGTALQLVDLSTSNLPAYTQWLSVIDEYEDNSQQANTLTRLSAVAYNFYFSLMQINLACSSLQDPAHCFRNILRDYKLEIFLKDEGFTTDEMKTKAKDTTSSSLWCVIAEGEEVVGHTEKGESGDWSDWVIKDRFKSAKGDREEYSEGDGPVAKFKFDFVWSVFPKANSKQFNFLKSQDRKIYIEEFYNCAYMTVLSMVKRAKGKKDHEDKPLCFVFNPVGGGAFLRGVNPAGVESQIADLIPIILVTAFKDCTRNTGYANKSQLVLVGFGDIPLGGQLPVQNPRSTLAEPWLAYMPSSSSSLSLARSSGSDDEQFSWESNLHSSCFKLPLNVCARNCDMVQASRHILEQRPGWKVGLSMAADENRLGNYYLGFDFFNKMSLGDADPYVGARRASDENTTRRTTAMVVAMVFNSLTYGGGRKGGKAPGSTASASWISLVAALHNHFDKDHCSFMLDHLRVVHGPDSIAASCLDDRSLFLDLHNHPVSGKNILHGFLKDIQRYLAFVPNANVKTVIGTAQMKPFITRL